MLQLMLNQSFNMKDNYCNFNLFVNSLFTFDKSTPVRAWTAGGTWPTNLVSSFVTLFSPPPRRTISSVLANGADTSAAIWKTNGKIVQ
jgi:hypothetical protein